MVTVCIPKTLEDLRIRPDLLERGFPYVSTVKFEIATGLNLTRMRDEAKGHPSRPTPGHGIESIFLGRDLLPFPFRPLPEDAVIMGGTGGFELERDFVPLFIEPVKRLFVIL